MPPAFSERADQRGQERRPDTPMQDVVTVHVRYFASARAARGREEERVRLPDGASVADVVEQLSQHHPENLARILTAASFLLDGVAVRDSTQLVHDGVELDVLPPFAGG